MHNGSIVLDNGIVICLLVHEELVFMSDIVVDIARSLKRLS